MSLWLSGIGVSRGIAIARVQKMHGGELDIPEYTLPANEVEGEVVRFYGAQRRAKDQLREVRARIPEGTPGDIAAFIDTHILMMDDRSITDTAVGHIRTDRINAEAALQRTRDALIAVFEQMDDAYLRTRRDDVEHVCGRILRILLKSERQLPTKSEGGEAFVIVADDVTPADIILLAQQQVAAFVTEYGGPLSHTAILARSLGIPAIVGLRDARRLLRENETVIVDGEAGHVIADPDERALGFYRTKQLDHARHRADLVKLKGRAAISRDGVHIRLLANIELPEDARVAEEAGAEGVGLYRTEIPFMVRDRFPSEEEQRQIYRSQLEAFAPHPVVMRTLDIGGDKNLPYFPVEEINPFLGWRGIRITLDHPEIFLVQVRAMLKAAHGLNNLRILVPMITTVFEAEEAMHLVHRAWLEVCEEGIEVDMPPVGVMIEVPAAVYQARELAQRVDFLSVGSNDLTQYILAVDRNNPRVSSLYSSFHPAVLGALKHVVEAAHAEGKPVGVCGEMAGDPLATLPLMAMGFDSLSMNASALLRVKWVVRNAALSDARRVLDQVMGMDNAQVITAYLGRTMDKLGLGMVLGRKEPLAG